MLIKSSCTPKVSHFPTVKTAVGADIYLLRRFLRARQHDVQRAREMFLIYLDWRKKNSVDTILSDFVFQERDAFISLYPQGYHQTDKQVGPSMDASQICSDALFHGRPLQTWCRVSLFFWFPLLSCVDSTFWAGIVHPLVLRITPCLEPGS